MKRRHCDAFVNNVDNVQCKKHVQEKHVQYSASTQGNTVFAQTIDCMFTANTQFWKTTNAAGPNITASQNNHQYNTSSMITSDMNSQIIPSNNTPNMIPSNTNPKYSIKQYFTSVGPGATQHSMARLIPPLGPKHSSGGSLLRQLTLDSRGAIAGLLSAKDAQHQMDFIRGCPQCQTLHDDGCSSHNPLPSRCHYCERRSCGDCLRYCYRCNHPFCGGCRVNSFQHPDDKTVCLSCLG